MRDPAQSGGQGFLEEVDLYQEVKDTQMGKVGRREERSAQRSHGKAPSGKNEAQQRTWRQAEPPGH